MHEKGFVQAADVHRFIKRWHVKKTNDHIGIVMNLGV